MNTFTNAPQGRWANFDQINPAASLPSPDLIPGLTAQSSIQVGYWMSLVKPRAHTLTALPTSGKGGRGNLIETV